MNIMNNLENESEISIQVVDPVIAIYQLKKLNINARRNTILRDEIIVNLADKEKIVAWMISEGGWSQEEILSCYSELL